MTEDRKKIASFEDLEVFQRAYAISLSVHKMSLEMPFHEQRGLADQIRRSSKSICANIAEGFGKQSSSAEFKRYLMMALGSSDEMQVWIRYAIDLGYLDEKTGVLWRSEYKELSKMLQGLRRVWR